MSKKYKVLLAQYPLETNSYCIMRLNALLQAKGMEVIMMGNALPADIVARAVAERVDAIGITTYSGNEVVLSKRMMDLYEVVKRTVRRVAFLTPPEAPYKINFFIGGLINPANVPRLKAMGFGAVFLAQDDNDGQAEQILECIKRKVLMLCLSKLKY